MRDGTAEEYALIEGREAAYNRTLYLRVLDAVRALGAAEADPGYAVSRLAHSLQSATRAERDGRPADYVVAALIHDIGDGLAPYSHGSYAAAVLRPFVSEELCWIVSHHPLFQLHYYGPQTGDDVNAREAYRGHPWFDATVEFCERYDENCFDPDYDWLPLEHFAPAAEEVFSRGPMAPKPLPQARTLPDLDAGRAERPVSAASRPQGSARRPGRTRPDVAHGTGVARKLP
jgi:predicted HD phosphohydrolase